MRRLRTCINHFQKAKKNKAFERTACVDVFEKSSGEEERNKRMRPSLLPSLLPFNRISRCGRSGAGERPGRRQQRDTMTKAQLLLGRRRWQKGQLSVQPPHPPPLPPHLRYHQGRILEVHSTSLMFNPTQGVKVEQRRFCSAGTLALNSVSFLEKQNRFLKSSSL